MKSFRQWLVEGGKGSGTKITATGLNASGMVQHAMRYRPSVKPAKPFSPIKPKSGFGKQV